LDEALAEAEVLARRLSDPPWTVDVGGVGGSFDAGFYPRSRRSRATGCGSSGSTAPEQTPCSPRPRPPALPHPAWRMSRAQLTPGTASMTSRFEVACSSARACASQVSATRTLPTRTPEIWTDLDSGPSEADPRLESDNAKRAPSGVWEPEFEVVRGGVEPPTPRFSGARYDANWPNCGELSELPVAESIVGWTDLDGGCRPVSACTAKFVSEL
jgi:hypothetical protein